MNNGSNRIVFLHEIKNFRVKYLYFKQHIKLCPEMDYCIFSIQGRGRQFSKFIFGSEKHKNSRGWHQKSP